MKKYLALMSFLAVTLTYNLSMASERFGGQYDKFGDYIFLKLAAKRKSYEEYKPGIIVSSSGRLFISYYGPIHPVALTILEENFHDRKFIDEFIDGVIICSALVYYRLEYNKDKEIKEIDAAFDKFIYNLYLKTKNIKKGQVIKVTGPKLMTAEVVFDDKKFIIFRIRDL